MREMPRIDPMMDWDRDPHAPAVRDAYGLLAVDPNGAIERFIDLARQGSILSLFYLGVAFRYRSNVPRDFGRAEQYFRSAADAGNIPAYYELGRLYREQRHDEEARRAFEVAAAANYVPAIHFLGVFHLLGIGGPKNVAKGEECLERAAVMGSVVAERTLGRVLLTGPGFRRRWKGLTLLWAALLDSFTAINGGSENNDRLR
jgi:uncharacterized protein